MKILCAFAAILLHLFLVPGTLKGQDLGYREIEAPFENDFVLFELYGMIYEPGLLYDITLYVAPHQGEDFKKAEQAYLIFPQGEEFHYGKTDSIDQIPIKSSRVKVKNYTAYKLGGEVKVRIDAQWLQDARGELYFNILWDAMGEFGELKSDDVVFKIEATYDYDDKSILDRAGVTGTFMDPRDGKEYRTVQIGESVWMRDNLHYDAQFSKKKNDFVEMKKEGMTYSWWNAREACPAGWRLPTKKDFMYLKSYYENERHLLPGGVSKLDLESIYYNTFWEFWTSTPDEAGYITTFKFEWHGLETKTNKARGSYVDVGDWDKSLIRCVKD